MSEVQSYPRIGAGSTVTLRSALSRVEKYEAPFPDPPFFPGRVTGTGRGTGRGRSMAPFRFVRRSVVTVVTVLLES